jgi:dolichol-phosphate mannosyltransferase
MPAWNEASGIGDFLQEIHESFVGIEQTLIVVDDRSTDRTVAVLEQLRDSGLPLQVEGNQVNLGHGPTTVRALRLALETGAQNVIALDGDGQFLGRDIRACYDASLELNLQVIEGIRTRDSDPVYRKVTSLATRILVWSRCKSFPKDANTPLRVYQRSALEEILERIPKDSLVPNLMISAYVRANKMRIGFVEVSFIDRRGDNPNSTSWGRSRASLPSKKFIKFCGRATQDWLNFDPLSS